MNGRQTMITPDDFVKMNPDLLSGLHSKPSISTTNNSTMKIHQFSQQGKRSNNEDSIGHSAALLTVCDGMGGHNYGERASAFVVEAMLQAFPTPQALGKMEIQQQLNKVQQDLNALLEKEPELEKMGTTFTGVFITPDVWYAAHIGDSRIYLFRPSERKLWHTWDHSLVGELMRTKEITVEAGRFHPMSNRIAKAIIAQKDGKPASASIVKIDELKSGDVLLLCSDGVVEGWGDRELARLFSDESLSFEQKCEKLAQQCNAKSKDNNTALIAEIEEADAFSFGTNDELEWTTFAEVEVDYEQYLKDNQPEEAPAEEQEKEDEKPQTGTAETEKPEPEQVAQSNMAEQEKPEPEQKPAADSKKEPDKPIPAPSAENTVHQPSTSQRNDGHKRSNVSRIVIAIVLLVIAIALAFFFIPKGKDAPADEKTETPGRPSKTEAEMKLQGEEAAAFNAIKTVEDCDNYLKKYRDIATPERIKTVERKKEALEQKAKEAVEADRKKAEEEAQAAEQKPQNETNNSNEELLNLLQL